MQRKLKKQWGPYAPGTVVVDSLADAGASPGSAQVNAERMASLDEGGYFEPAEPERPIPGEVLTGGRELDKASREGEWELEVVKPDPAFTEAGTSRRAKPPAFVSASRPFTGADGAPQPETPAEPASAPPDQGEPAKKEP